MRLLSFTTTSALLARLAHVRRLEAAARRSNEMRAWAVLVWCGHSDPRNDAVTMDSGQQPPRTGTAAEHGELELVRQVDRQMAVAPSPSAWVRASPRPSIMIISHCC